MDADLLDRTDIGFCHCTANGEIADLNGSAFNLLNLNSVFAHREDALHFSLTACVMNTLPYLMRIPRNSRFLLN
jgi:hypothetical protein